MHTIKIACVAFAIAIVAGLALAGCSGGGESPAARGAAAERRTAAAEGGALPRVELSRSESPGVVDGRPYGTLQGKEAAEAFGEALRTAERLPEVPDEADVADGGAELSDYDVVLETEGGSRSFHLWLNRTSARGIYADTERTGTRYALTERATERLKELVGSIRYEPELAAANGDVVLGLGKTLNPKAWTAFLRRVQAEKPAAVRIVSYSIEGAPIFYDLDYDGRRIRYRLDTSRDPHGKPLKTTEYCGRIESERTERGTGYALAECANGERSATFGLVFGDEAK